MDRRKFLTGLFAASGAAAALAISGGTAEASSLKEFSLLDELTAVEACEEAPAEIAADAADLPAEQAADAHYYFRRPRYRHVRRPRRHVYRRVRYTHRVRHAHYGRRRVVRQRCWYVHDRFGRLVQRCG